MKYLTKNEFIKLASNDKYWIGRWQYISKVIDILKQERFTSVLELGAYTQTVVKESDTMDKDKYLNVTYHWDATQTPYPIQDKQYDLFIALQVWEHLYRKKGCREGKQREVFAEVMRIANMAVLSFPYKWNMPGNCHHGIDNKKIAEWTLGVKPEKIVKAGTRIIYFFKFDGNV